jgi:hypothetical protein
MTISRFNDSWMTARKKRVSTQARAATPPVFWGFGPPTSLV